MAEKQVLITGVSGHLGANLSRAMLEAGFRVRGMALPGEDCSFLDPRVQVVRGDVWDCDSLRRMFEGMDNPVFVHAAAVISIKRNNSRMLYDINVGGTANALKVSREFGVSRFIYVGSVDALYCRGRNVTVDEVDGFHPQKLGSPYARSKAMAANLVMESGIEHCIILPSGMIGPDDYRKGLMSMVFSCYLNGKLKVGVSGGFDFVDIRDVAEAITEAAILPKVSETYILSNTFSNTTDLLNELLRIAGRRPLRNSLSVGFVRMVVPLAGLYFRAIKENNPLTLESTRLLGKNIRFSCQRARKELGFRTRPITQTLSDILSFARKQKWVTA